MSPTLLVCDDSAMARKQILRALSGYAHLNILQAAHGREALDIIQREPVDVLLLDLTMPEVDGYGVLAALREQEARCQVVVISGDVQEAAVQRVKALGARAFLKKPCVAEDLCTTLADLGLSTAAVNAVAAASEALDVGFRDAFREIANIAMGRAGALLARMLGVFVQLPVPVVNIFEVGELHMALSDVQRGERLSAVCQGYIGDRIAGEGLLIFHDSEVTDMGQLMGWPDVEGKAAIEVMLDLASLLICTCLTAIGDQLDSHFSLSHPVLLGQHSPLEELIRINHSHWRKTLAVEISYTLEAHSLHFDLLLLFTEDSIPRLSEKVHYLLK